jgi:hypothetical protein
VQTNQTRYDASSARVGNDWPAIAIQIAVATIFSGVIAYVATNPEQLVQAQAAVSAVDHAYTPTTALPAPPPAVRDEPVQVEVANPFDKSEIFHFPAGTSETEAHLAVAKLLMQRAHEREQLWAHSEHRLRKRANHMQPVAGTGLTSLAEESAPAVAVGSAGAPQS